MYLNCHTAFSFKYGTLSVQRLFDEAQRHGVRKLVLTEINNTASYIEMFRLRAEQAAHTDGERTNDPLDIAVGVEFRRDNRLLYIAIARNNDGFERINRFLSYHNLTEKNFPERAPEFGKEVVVIYPFGKIDPEQLRTNEYVGIRKQQLNQFRLYAPRNHYPDRFVILHPVTFIDKSDFNVHRLLRAIDRNTLLSKLPEHDQASPDEIMLPETELVTHFQDFPELIHNTRILLDACSLDVDLGIDKNKKHLTGSVSNDWDMLVTRAWEGFQNRYDAGDSVLRERFQRELDIIRLKGFCAYFLIAYDLIKFAKAKGFDYVGRGSGANSMVAYCLGITNVDPIELDLYFERFLNPERSSPPDFDIDFSWDNRDAVYDYLFEKYGKDHVCLLGTHVTYQRRSVLRELGKVFGLPRHEIDAMVEAPDRHRHRDHITELIFRYADRMLELPANLSIHAGGVLITEKPIFAYTAVDKPPKGYPVSHFEMHSAEDLGIFKFDILSQRGLGHLKEAVHHIRRNRGTEVDLLRFDDFKKDESVRALLRDSQTMGCFYVESPAMRMLLSKLRCEDYITLVAASSIIRPGVARSGMMRAYIERFHAVRKGSTYESIHPKLDELMRETFGVMVYQEDVIKVAHHFAKLSLAEADVLRRGMSGKFRSRKEFEKVRDRFFENCRNEGYPEAVTQRVWYEIESFSGYSFSKGHSASYAVESYQSLYLKAHYPLEFMVGVINNFGGFYKTEFYFHEARKSGGTIHAPCVNRSTYLTTLYGNDIYIGFIHLRSLETNLAQRVVAEREANGAYKSLDNFLRRVDCGLEQVRILIRIGAFRFSGKSRQRLLWEAMLWFSNKKVRTSRTAELFDMASREYPLPELQRSPLENAFDEIELLGFPLCDPFLLADTSDYGNTTARQLGERKGMAVSILGYLITTKDTGTKDGHPMQFGTFYDRHGDVFDTVHFPNVARKSPFRGRGFYHLQGKVTEDFGVFAIEVRTMEKIPFVDKRMEKLEVRSPSLPHGPFCPAS